MIKQEFLIISTQMWLEKYMKILLLFNLLFLSFNTFADESTISLEKRVNNDVSDSQEYFEDVRSNLEYFFKDNEDKLKSVYPEFKISELVKKMENAEVEFIDNDTLIDDAGVVRTCLNYPNLSLIKCSASLVAKFDNSRNAVYPFILNQYLELINVKKSKSSDETFVDGYNISKRIFPHIVNNSGSVYLIYNSLSSKRIMSTPGYEKKLKAEVWPYQRVSNNWFIERYTSLYPTEKRLIKKTLEKIDNDRCHEEGQKIIYKDAKAYGVFNSRISCIGDRCPQTEGLVVVRYMCG